VQSHRVCAKLSLSISDNLLCLVWRGWQNHRHYINKGGFLYHASLYILQEVFAKIIMYNFAEMITSHVIISQPDTKHVYQVNFTVAIHICRYFLRLWGNAPSHDVEALIRKNILPVRPGRKDNRKIRYKTAVSFLYRVA
jgi:hypothetical protein